MSHKYLFPPEIYLSDGQILDVVSESKILGVIISSDLKWSKNTDYIVSKAMKRIWILRRLRKLGFEDKFLIEVYKKEIRSLLEYAVQIWNGAITKKESSKIENIQKIFLKFLLKQKYESYSEACEQYGLKKLFLRRHDMCLKFALKQYRRNTDFFLKIRTKNYRKVSKKKFVHEPQTRTSRHFNSCYSYLSRILNRELQHKNEQ